MAHIKDIIGYKKEVEKLGSICDFLKNTDKYIDFGVELPNALLICGLTGVGKTFMTEALSEDCDRQIFDLCVHGVTTKKVKSIFKKARKAAYSVLIIDDIDYLDVEGDNNIYSCIDDEINDCINCEVFVIITAYKKGNLPKYLLSTIGNDMIIELQPPKIEEACDIFKPIFNEEKVEQSFNMNDFCCFAQNWTYSSVEYAYNNAARLAVYERSERITMKHLIQAGLLYKGYELSEKFDEATAYHEAGHAAVSLLLGGDAACIILHGVGSGFFKEKDLKIKTYQDRERGYIVSVAGKACEEIFTGTSSIGSYSDLERVSEEIEADVRALASQGFEYFDSTELNSPAYNDMLAKKVQSDIQKYYDRAKELIIQNRPLVIAFTEKLKEKHYLLHSEIYKIFDHYNELRNKVDIKVK